MLHCRPSLTARCRCLSCCRQVAEELVGGRHLPEHGRSRRECTGLVRTAGEVSASAFAACASTALHWHDWAAPRVLPSPTGDKWCEGTSLALRVDGNAGRGPRHGLPAQPAGCCVRSRGASSGLAPRSPRSTASSREACASAAIRHGDGVQGCVRCGSSPRARADAGGAGDGCVSCVSGGRVPDGPSPHHRG